VAVCRTMSFFCDLVYDEFLVVEVADDCFGAGLLEAVGVFLTADEAGYFVVFGDE